MGNNGTAAALVSPVSGINFYNLLLHPLEEVRLHGYGEFADILLLTHGIPVIPSAQKCNFLFANPKKFLPANLMPERMSTKKYMVGECPN